MRVLLQSMIKRCFTVILIQQFTDLLLKQRLRKSTSPLMDEWQGSHRIISHIFVVSISHIQPFLRVHILPPTNLFAQPTISHLFLRPTSYVLPPLPHLFFGAWCQHPPPKWRGTYAKPRKKPKNYAVQFPVNNCSF